MKTKIPDLSLTRLCGGILLLCAGVSLAVAQTTMPEPGGSPREKSAPPGSPAATTPGVYSTTASDNSNLTSSDRRFLKKFDRVNEEEVTLSRIAADRATNSQVRSFASDMVSAHTSAGSELSALGEKKGVVFEPRDDATVSKEKKKWLEKKGDSFDKDYIDKIISGHKDAIDLLEDGADSKDADIAAFSNKMLPDVKGHLERAKALAKTLD